MRNLFAPLLILLAAIRADASSIPGGMYSYQIGQVGLAFILPSSGTMGNNGALTGLTAMQATYGSAYIYMPAGAIAAASTAGWYFAQCSSSSACTVFNNTYTSGVPVIPSSPTPFVTTGPGAYTQTTGSNIVGLEIPIAGGSMGPRGAVATFWSISTPTNANNKTALAKYGAQGAGGTLINATLTANINATFLSTIVNRGVTGVQITTNTNGMPNGSNQGLGYPALDTTQTQWINFGMQLAVATDYMVTELVTIMLSPAW